MNIAGPRQLPLVGNLLEFRDDPLRFLMETTLRYGDLAGIRFGPERIVVLSAPEHMRHVFQDNYKNYGKESRVWQKMEPLLGRGLITSQGEEWRRQRRTIQPSFHRELVAGFGPAIMRAINGMLERWDTAASKGQPIEIVSEMMRLALVVLGDTLFGADLQADAETLHSLVTRILHGVNQQTRTVLYFLPAWLPTPENIAFKRAVKALDQVVDRMIEDNQRDAERSGSLIMSLIRAKDTETDQALSPALIRDQVKSFLFAGHETTAIGMAWTLYHLSKYPAEAARVRDELKSVLNGRPATVSDLPQLGHLDRFIKETLRIYPPVWFLGRNALGPDTIGGLDLPPGALVMPTPYVTHHRPDIWQNPEGFDPDRFLPERFDTMNRFAYLPFGAGPRQCVGLGFATMEMMLVIASIAQRFDLDLLPGHPIAIDAGITLRPKFGLRAHVSRSRSSSSREVTQDPTATLMSAS